MSRKLNLIGRRFGILTVEKEYLIRDKRSSIKWECKCDCGKDCVVLGSNLITGNTRSCGCLGLKNKLASVTHHGLSKHPLHNTWRRIIQRCNNPNNKSYKEYGARGVRICKEWENDFMSFYNWAISKGWKKGLEIDKDKIAKENGLEPLLYSPERCSLLTRKENCRYRRNNRLITCRGMTMTLAEFAELVGEKSDIISYRMRHGWSEEDAIFTPFKRRENVKLRRK
jgi:hypothetical protein